MDISADKCPPPPPYTESAVMQPAVSKDANVAPQQNTGNISINVNCVPSQQESTPQYMPQVQAYPQPQMNQVPFQQPQFQLVQVQQPQYVVNRQPAMGSGNLGPNPSITTCTNCGQRVTTNVIYKAGAFAWVMCVVFVLFGLICGCCVIPFCMDSFQDAYHSCPQCHASLHIHKQL